MAGWLAPAEDLLWGVKRGEVSREEFRRRYVEGLDLRRLHGEMREWFVEDRNVAFVCCEKDRGECHGEFLAEVIEDLYGIRVEEWKAVKECA